MDPLDMDDMWEAPSPDDQPDRDTQRTDMATALMGLNDTLDVIVKAASGYRLQLEAAGYSPTMAEAMSAHYHNLLLQKALTL